MSDPFNALSDQLKLLLDGISIFALLGSLVQVLPSIAALLTIVWTAIRIIETRTVQSWLTRRATKLKDEADD